MYTKGNLSSSDSGGTPYYCFKGIQVCYGEALFQAHQIKFGIFSLTDY